MRHTLRAAAALVLALALIGAAPPQQRALLTLRVNTVPEREITVVLNGKDVLVRRADLESAGLHGFGFNAKGGAGDLVSLESLAPAVTYRVDDTNLTLDLTVSGEHFGNGAAIDLQNGERLPITPAARSVFVNYAVGGTTGAGLIAAGEAGTRIGAGVFDSTWSSQSAGSGAQSLTRWFVDEPKTAKRITAGDFLTDTGDLGGAVPLFGLNSQRYFGFNTGIVRSVLPGLSGVVDSPSVANIYINGTLYRQQTLPPGQFNLQNLPVQNGAANMQVVVTDAFGRQQTFSRSFYASDALLAPGLTDFSYGAGVIRPQFGTAPVSGFGVAGRYAAGVSANLTAGARFEMAGRILSGGPNIAVRLPAGVLGLAAAVSEDAGSGGAAALASYQYSSPRISLAASMRYQSAAYATLSIPASFDRPMLTANISAGIPLSARTSLGVSYLQQHFRDSGTQSDLQISQWRTLNQYTTLQFTQSVSTYGGARHLGFATQLNFTPRANESATFGATSNDGHPGVTATFDKALSAQSPSLGYDVSVNGAPGSSSVFGQAQYRWQYGDYLANVNLDSGQRSIGVNAAGGIVFIGRKAFATRPLSDSYALVDAGLPGVRIMANNVEAGRTDRHGYLVVPQLESYFGNDISVNAADAPVNTEIAATTQRVVPMAKTGAIIRFDMRPVRTITGTLRVRTAAGVLPPAYGLFELSEGAVVRTSDIGENGEFFFENIPAGNYRGTIRYRGGMCLMTVQIPQNATSPFMKLGTLLCEQRSIR